MGRRVVVAEASKDFRILLRKVLEHAGFDVEISTSGLGLLTVWGTGLRNHVDAVLLIDQLLPDVSGLEVTRRLRNVGCRQPIVLMAMTGAAGIEAEAKSAGASSLLQKPFDIDALCVEMNRQFGLVS